MAAKVKLQTRTLTDRRGLLAPVSPTEGDQLDIGCSEKRCDAGRKPTWNVSPNTSNFLWLAALTYRAIFILILGLCCYELFELQTWGFSKICFIVAVFAWMLDGLLIAAGIDGYQ